MIWAAISTQNKPMRLHRVSIKQPKHTAAAQDDLAGGKGQRAARLNYRTLGHIGPTLADFSCSDPACKAYTTFCQGKIYGQLLLYLPHQVKRPAAPTERRFGVPT